MTREEIKALAFALGAIEISTFECTRLGTVDLRVSWGRGVDREPATRKLQDTIRERMPAAIWVDVHDVTRVVEQKPVETIINAAAGAFSNMLPKLSLDEFAKLLQEDGWIYFDELVPVAKQPKYPGDCPCGINARGCDYHRDM